MENLTYRKDYLAPTHWIDNVELTFEIHDEDFEVTSRLHVRPNPDRVGSPDATTLRLNVGNSYQTLLSVKVDNHYLADSEYRLETVRDVPFLVIPNLNEPTVVETACRVRLDRGDLKGIYRSGNTILSQCEAEGFREITPMLDRPDVMSRYTVTIRADKARYPVLLSNGNLVRTQDLEDGRHEAVFDDPFLKPAYLFALVAGNLFCHAEKYRLGSGREVELAVYVDPQDHDKTSHTMESLKKAIAWDEKRFGLELDLDHFRIVATQDFNFGAMENKGLNIFNARLALANPSVATDMDYHNIESVVGHEYFHNWTGNRVTLRDWFQLTLKEGLTVFRDQEFTSDMLGEESARAVERIRNVEYLRNFQFREDAGPMSHPIRPDQYEKIDNFYTATVYEKGSEVIRMLHTLLGEDTFRTGFDLYIARNDGKAVTCEAFLDAMQEASGRDLSQFKRWYSTSGTPHIDVRPTYVPERRELIVHITQSFPHVAAGNKIEPLLIPFPISFMDQNGNPLPVKRRGDTSPATVGVKMFEVTQMDETWVFEGLADKPVVSLNHNFAAPIELTYPYTKSELACLVEHDPTPFIRWDAMQQLMIWEVKDLLKLGEQHASVKLGREIEVAFNALLQDSRLSPAFLAVALQLPTNARVSETLPVIDPQAVEKALAYLRQALGSTFSDPLYERANDAYENHAHEQSQLTPMATGRRAMIKMFVSYLLATNYRWGLVLTTNMFYDSQNLTDRINALSLVSHTMAGKRNQMLDDAWQAWHQEPLLVNKWLNIRATSPTIAGEQSVVNQIRELMDQPFFSLANPNNVNALLGSFFTHNPSEFHAPDTSGYQLWYETVLRLNEINPVMAARMARALENWRRYKPELADAMFMAWEHLSQQPNLSQELREVIHKALQPIQ